jgi:hypothetical protein
VSAVVDGPNTGWYYTREPVPERPLVTYLNRALDPEGAWFQRQSGGRVPGDGFYCGRGDALKLRDDALKHEGVTPGWPRSHYDVYNDFLGANDINAQLEALHGFVEGTTPQQFLDAVTDAWNQFVNDMDTVQKAQVDVANPVTFSCTWRFPQNIR